VRISDEKQTAAGVLRFAERHQNWNRPQSQPGIARRIDGKSSYKYTI